MQQPRAQGGFNYLLLTSDAHYPGCPARTHSTSPSAMLLPLLPGATSRMHTASSTTRMMLAAGLTLQLLQLSSTSALEASPIITVGGGGGGGGVMQEAARWAARTYGLTNAAVCSTKPIKNTPQMRPTAPGRSALRSSQPPLLSFQSPSTLTYPPTPPSCLTRPAATLCQC